MADDKDDDQLTDEETRRRLERALKRSLTTPPKPITKKDSDQSKSKKRPTSKD